MYLINAHKAVLNRLSNTISVFIQCTNKFKAFSGKSKCILKENFINFKANEFKLKKNFHLI